MSGKGFILFQQALNRELWKIAKDNLDEDYENRFHVLIEIVKIAKQKIYEGENIAVDLENIILESIKEYENEPLIYEDV